MYCISNLFLSKSLSINKCTLLDCTNTEIRIYTYIPTVHAFRSVNFTHTLLVQIHTYDVFAPCTSMPSPLAPDPIRVQSCVCCLF